MTTTRNTNRLGDRFIFPPYISGEKLWNYDNLEPSENKLVL